MRAQLCNFSLISLISVLSAFSVVNPSSAHPVPKRSHDRTIVVWLTPSEVVIDYRLEVDDWTIVYVDLPALSDGDKVNLTKLFKPQDFYEAFTQAYAPILADNLIAKLDGKPLQFACSKHNYEVADSIRCSFVCRAAWRPALGQQHEFVFREGNYELESGLLKVSLETDPAITLLNETVPDETLKARALIDLQPGDEEKLRKAAATFTLTSTSTAAPNAVAESAGEQTQTGSHPTSLLSLLLDSEQGLCVLLLLAAGFGAAHALTPGHGKTLVAAYLIGEHGTVWHALLLGLVVTLTHTGAVLLIAAGLFLFAPRGALDGLETALEFIGGLLVAGVGLWLLLRRLAGRADHIHIGGWHHHHHDDHHGHDHDHHHDHSHADHYHDEHGHAHPLPVGQDRVG